MDMYVPDSPALPVVVRRHCTALLVFVLPLMAGFPSAIAKAGAWPVPGQAGQDLTPFSEFDPPAWFAFDHWLLRLALLLVIFLVAATFFLFVVFPRLLTKHEPWWPRTAYNLCLACVFSVVLSAALLLFWNDLGSASDAAQQRWWVIWGGRAALIGIGCLVVFFLSAVFRCRHSRWSGRSGLL